MDDTEDELQVDSEILERIRRRAEILIGWIPVAEMTADEIEWHLRHEMRQWSTRCEQLPR